jgi:flagellar biosynthesis component FlhA
MQSETNKMKNIIDNLEKENKILKDDNIKYLSNIKSLKTELKSQLSEKISIVNELNSLKMKHNNIYYQQ